MTTVRETKFTQRLKALMKEEEMTANELSMHVYMNVSTIKGYITGRHEPIVETLVLMCKLFNVSADYLIGLTDDRKALKE